MRFSPLLLLAWLVGCSSPPAAPVLSEVNPAVLNADQGGAIELRGEGFLPTGVYDFDQPDRSSLSAGVSAWLEQGGRRLELLDATWVDARLISARVPAGSEPGWWSVRLITPRGFELSLVDALRLEPTLTDAGLLLDGGLPDGGQPDAGALDAGPVDAGPIDAGPIDAGPQPCQTWTFFDDDGDGFGVPDSGAFLCGPGRGPVEGDCNDVDPLSSPAGTEVCNALDDDCDGVTDELGCPDAGPTRLRLVDGGEDFLSASAWASDSLWIAGGSTLLVRTGDAGLIDVSTNCPMGMNAVWAQATGAAFVGGGNNGVGRLTTATRDAGCVTSELLPEPVVGMVGFPAPDGGTVLEVLLRDGRRLAWDGVSPVVVLGLPLPVGTELVDAHAAGPGAFYAVGGTVGPPRRPAVYRMGADGSLLAEDLTALSLPDGWLRGVWALSPNEAVAVGEQGVVLRRVQGNWQRIPPPAAANYTSVRAFSVGRFYASTDVGSLQQWSGRWAVWATDPLPVRDLTAFDEAHFWLVGDHELIIKVP